jgi:hypothetical protein
MTIRKVEEYAWSSDIDVRVFELARSYLLGRGTISGEMLDQYVRASPGSRKSATLAEVYEQLLRSAQSAQSMPNVIGGSIGGIEKLSTVLFGFDPVAVAKKYPRSDESCKRLFDDIREQLAPRGKLNYNQRSLWRRFCGTVTSGAAFLAQFPDAQAFYAWGEPFDVAEEDRVQIATEIARQIDGIGFALACDFLKGVGFTNFSKPDVHIKEIFTQLGLSATRDDVEVFKAVGRIARNVGVTPFEADQLFWLVGSGDLYFAGRRIANSRAEFIALARKALGESMPEHESTSETDLASTLGKETSAVMPVREVVEIVREWVDLHARHLPGFAGAYLWAGITALPPDAPFPLYRDVDVVLVLPEGTQGDTVEVFYRGVMLEVISIDPKDHQDAESILANPSHGPNMATTQILTDPTGILTPLHQKVAAEYGKRRWIEARCEKEKASAAKQLAAMRAAATPQERLDSVWAFVSALSGLLAVAQLKRPTTRRTLALLGELLDEQGRSDLHEEALTLFGSAHMSRADVQTMLDQSVVAFDRSVEVYHTPTPYGFTIRPHLRPYLSEATQEMIDEGNYREAVFWISALAGESYLVLQNDAPEEEKPEFAAQLKAMHIALGYADAPADVWAARVASAERLAHEIYSVADTLTRLHPE